MEVSDVQVADVDDAVEDEGVSWATDESMPTVGQAEPTADGRTVAQQVDEDFEFQVTWPDGTEDIVDASVTTEVPVTPEPQGLTGTDDGAIHFEVPEHVADGEDDVAADVPDDVADAVRRAIAAIESVAVEPDGLPAGVPSAHGAEPEAPLPMPQRFAPPTPDMRAEVIYGAEAATRSEQVDTDHGDDGDERSSALRRLIGSLRRKDH